MNSFSPRERAHLRRSAKKLEQLLGSMPHIVDRESVDGFPTFHDVPSRANSASPPSSTRSSISTSSTLSRTWSLTRRRGHTLTSNSWPDRLPLVQLSRPKLAAMLAEKHDVSLTCPPSPSSSFSEDEEMPATLTNSRLLKMDKLRRTLGDGVPIHLVFKSLSEPPSSPDAEDGFQFVPEHKTTLSASSSTSSRTRLLSARPRDSILYCPSPHKAPRLIRRKPVPSSRTPSPPPTSIEELEMAVEADIRKLFAILEDECRVGENVEKCLCSHCSAE